MKDHEIYSNLRAVAPCFVRADGRNFRKTLSNLKCKQPYDLRFAKVMADTAELLICTSGFSPALAFTFSDEISLLFCELPYGGRIEKLSSVVASYISSAFTLKMPLNKPVAFDCRVVPVGAYDIQTYLTWRQAEAWRNHVNAYGYYCLRKAGFSGREAHEKLRNMTSHEIHEVVFAHGVNLAKTPAWQRRGILIYKEHYRKAGYNTLLQQEVVTLRTKVVQNWGLPVFGSPEGKKFLSDVLSREHT
jgi:tRNA(His) 5'-end guanylyltransferase